MLLLFGFLRHLKLTITNWIGDPATHLRFFSFFFCPAPRVLRPSDEIHQIKIVCTFFFYYYYFGCLFQDRLKWCIDFGKRRKSNLNKNMSGTIKILKMQIKVFWNSTIFRPRSKNDQNEIYSRLNYVLGWNGWARDHGRIANWVLLFDRFLRGRRRCLAI